MSAPIMAALGWLAGRRLDIRIDDGIVAISADDAGAFAMVHRRYVRLPLTVRRWHQLQAGDRIFLAAYPAGDLLMVHLPQAFDALLANLHARALGGLRDE